VYKKGDHLGRVESVPAGGTVDAQQAAIASSKTDIASYIAAKTPLRPHRQAKADLDRRSWTTTAPSSSTTASCSPSQDFDAKKAAS